MDTPQTVLRVANPEERKRTWIDEHPILVSVLVSVGVSVGSAMIITLWQERRQAARQKSVEPVKQPNAFEGFNPWMLQSFGYGQNNSTERMLQDMKEDQRELGRGLAMLLERTK